jgi:hypothetical protein
MFGLILEFLRVWINDFKGHVKKLNICRNVVTVELHFFLNN